MPNDKGINFLQKVFGGPTTPHPYAAPTPDAHVTPDATRCVQCGCCGYNCPVGIPVRDFARMGKMVDDPRCVQCGQCIEVCPRGTLRWSRANLVTLDNPDEAEYAELMQAFFKGDESAS
jgi:ferredoxin